MGWQPIETAPKDEDVLLFVQPPEDHRKMSAYICVGYWWGGGWELSKDGSGAYDSSVDGEPTHWMPLPVPPMGDT